MGSPPFIFVWDIAAIMLVWFKDGEGPQFGRALLRVKCTHSHQVVLYYENIVLLKYNK